MTAVSGVVTLAEALDFETASSHSITVEALSEDGSTASETFTIIVNDVNDNAPTFDSANIADVDENTTFVQNLLASDVDSVGDPITFSIIGGDDGGLFEITAGNQLQFAEPQDFEMPTGGDTTFSVVVAASDGLNTTQQTITVNLVNVNEAPTDIVLTPDQVQIAENSTIGDGTTVASIAIVDDALGVNDLILTGADAASFDIVGDAESGFSLVFVDTSSDFENPTDSGSDNVFDVTVSVSDATVVGSGPATASFQLMVSDINEEPMIDEDASDIAILGDEDTDITGSIVANDVDAGDILTFGILTDPTNGTVTIDETTGAYTFSPSANANGPDSFVVQVTDAGGLSDQVTVNVTMTPVNDAPTVGDPVAATFTDNGSVQAVNLLAGAADIENDILSIQSLQVFGNTAGVTPDLVNSVINIDLTAYDFLAVGDSEVLTATFDIIDGNGGTVSQTATITINGENDGPVIDSVTSDVVAEGDEDTSITGTVVASDVDDSAVLSFAIDTDNQPQNGSVGINALTGEYTYAPNLNFNGLDSFTVIVEDDQGATDEIVVNVTVNAVDDAPTAADTTATTDEDEATAIDVTDLITEVDGDTTIVTASVPESQGTVSVEGTVITFTPAADFNGEATITYTVTDETGAALFDEGSIDVTVNAVNDAPVVEAISAPDASEDAGEVTIDLLAGQIDPDEGTILSVNTPLAASSNTDRTVTVSVDDNGVLTLDTNQFNDLAVGASETVTITYNVSDGIIDVENTAIITITGANDGLVTVSFRVLEWNNRHQGEQLWHTNTMMNSNAKRCVLH